jgi:phosphonate transport system substrate-binding protein
MQFIVPVGSSIQKLDDLKGRTVTFTTRDSNSGCKAAIALLHDHELLPQRDYSWKFSGGHEESIKRIVAREYQVAPVASDLLQRAVTTGAVEPDQFRIIYESERFPPVTFGYAHDLTDELAADISKAFLEFDGHGTSMQKTFEDSSTSRFVPLSYKQDYALIRRIDAAFRKPSSPASE